MKSTKFPDGTRVKFKPDLKTLFDKDPFGLEWENFSYRKNDVFTVQDNPIDYNFRHREPSIYVGKFDGEGATSGFYTFPEDWFIRVGNEVEDEE